MSQLGQKQTWSIEGPISALPSTADIDQGDANVRFVPGADIPSIFRKAPSLLPRGEIGGEQIRIEALNKPFEEFAICEHAF
jgi:hypothetical protein